VADGAEAKAQLARQVLISRGPPSSLGGLTLSIAMLRGWQAQDLAQLGMSARALETAVDALTQVLFVAAVLEHSAAPHPQHAIDGALILSWRMHRQSAEAIHQQLFLLQAQGPLPATDPTIARAREQSAPPTLPEEVCP
jgi:hypothetical protein